MEVLKEPRDAQSSFSSERQSTVWRALPTLEALQDRWETFASMAKFSRLKGSIEKGIEKMKKYYRLLDQNNVGFICLALDPNFKLEYVKETWDEQYFAEGKAALEREYDCYAAQLAAKAPAEANIPEPYKYNFL
ncbi:hypothetical protein APHAL10511_005761 [Amanita phalloides]|nr:hypothetical protein APHAL10511_005761 [Amanita phalloides]